MEKTLTGTIYKISIGTSPHGAGSLTFTANHDFPSGDGTTVKISAIIEDTNYYYYFGKIRYVVYAKNNAGLEFIFRSFCDMPCSVTYNVPKELSEKGT